MNASDLTINHASTLGQNQWRKFHVWISSAQMISERVVKLTFNSLSRKKQFSTLSLTPVIVCLTATEIASTLIFIWCSHVPASFPHRKIDGGDKTTLFYNVRPHFIFSTAWYGFMVSGLFVHDKVYPILTERKYYSRIIIRFGGRHRKLNKYP